MFLSELTECPSFLNLRVAIAQYIPFDRSAGETEFLEKVYQKREDIEPLCEDTKAEKCYYVSTKAVPRLTGTRAELCYLHRHGTIRG